MPEPTGDPLDVALHQMDLPMPIYFGPVAGPDTPEVVVFDCPVLESPDRPYRRNVLFAVALAGTGPITAVRAHECNGEQHPGLPRAPIIGASYISRQDALAQAAVMIGVTE
jgi:hypothetical protein